MKRKCGCLTLLAVMVAGAYSVTNAAVPLQNSGNAAEVFLAAIPRDDFFASHPGKWAPSSPQLWADPLTNEKCRFKAEETNYFPLWKCDTNTGLIRYIYRLGIHPLGTHSPKVAKDSLVLSQDEWSGGFPVVYYTHSLLDVGEGSALYGKDRVFNIERATYDRGKGRWFSEIALDAPGTMFGVATRDGTKNDFIFMQYQYGMKRGGQGEWIPGQGPMANKPGGESRVPGVMAHLPQPGEPDAELYPHTRLFVGWPLFGRGALGLTSILRACHGHGLPGGEVPECILDNPTLFDYRADGRPHAFAASVYMQGGSLDNQGHYVGRFADFYIPQAAEKLIPTNALTHSPKGEPMLRSGDWIFRYDDTHAEAGWQLDPQGCLDTNVDTINSIHGTNDKFLTSDWADSSVSLLDGTTKQRRKLVMCTAVPHVAMGEPSGSEHLFIFLGTRAPYGGPTFGLDAGVFCHDIYLASVWPIEFHDGCLVEPAVVRIFRQVLGRNPSVEEAFRYTAQLRSGMAEQQLRDLIVDSDDTKGCLQQIYRCIIAKEPDTRELTQWKTFLRNGGTFEHIVTRLKDRSPMP